MPSKSEKEKQLRQTEGFAGFAFAGALILFATTILLYSIHSFFWGIVFAFVAFVCGENGFKFLRESSEVKGTIKEYAFSPPCIFTIGDTIITYKYRIPNDLDTDEVASLFPSQSAVDRAITGIYTADPHAPLSKYEDVLNIKVLDIHRKAPPPHGQGIYG